MYNTHIFGSPQWTFQQLYPHYPHYPQIAETPYSRGFEEKLLFQFSKSYAIISLLEIYIN